MFAECAGTQPPKADAVPKSHSQQQTVLREFSLVEADTGAELGGCLSLLIAKGESSQRCGRDDSRGDMGAVERVHVNV